MITAHQKVNGNWDVRNDNGQTIAVIAHNPATGWRVFTASSARKNSRTSSTTPEEAARKYFSRKIKFLNPEPLPATFPGSELSLEMD